MIRYEDLIDGQGIDDMDDENELNHGAISYWYGKAVDSGMTSGEAVIAVAEDLSISVSDVIKVVG